MQDQFIRERKYLMNVSPATIQWYESSFKAFQGAVDAVNLRVVELRERGVRPVSINTYLRCVRAYFKWAGIPGKIRRLKEEQKVLTVFSLAEIQQLLGFKPQRIWARRVHCLAVLILDTGVRASEALGLTAGDVDLDNLILKVAGKGGKHRLIPFSMELRKFLWRYSRRPEVLKRRYLFGTQNQTRLSVRNFERDFHKLGDRLDIAGCNPHRLRHTFATEFLRRGGNVCTLSRILGHSSVNTTERYLHLVTTDLSAAQARFSLLAR